MKTGYFARRVALTIIISVVMAAGCKSPGAEDKKYTDYEPDKKVVDQNEATKLRQEKNILALPTPQQLAFQDLEYGMFIHYGLNTYTGQSHGDGKEPPSKLNPTNLDCEQWANLVGG